MSSSLPPFWELFKSRHTEIEKNVSQTRGSYQGLSPEALYTSETDLLNIFNHPLTQGTFCDLGCGTGLPSLLYGHLFPERHSIGIEFEESRLEIGRNLRTEYQLSNVELVCADLSKADLPRADVYFLYFPTGHVLDRVLSVLYEQHSSFKLIAIESHGDLLPRLGLENWLEEVAEIKLSSPRHYPSAKVFESKKTPRSKALYPFTLSYQEKFLLISDEEWIGETFQMEWSGSSKFDLSLPPRTIKWSDVKNVLSFDEIPENYRTSILLRRLGEIEVKTATQCFKGSIRKIMTRPTFHLELSGGELVEWNEIISISQGPHICYESSAQSSF